MTIIVWKPIYSSILISEVMLSFQVFTSFKIFLSCTEAATERCSVKKVFVNFWSKSLKNTCEEVHFLLSCRLQSLQLN